MPTERFCLYCFTKDRSKLTKSHLFPKSIGGRLYEYYSCERCNRILGHEIEGQVKKYLLFAQAIARLKLEPIYEAFKDIDIIDLDTGDRLMYVDDKLVGRERKPRDGKRVAPPRELRRLALQDVRKRFPNWVECYSKELAKGSCVIRLPGETHTFYVEKKSAKVEFSSKVSFPMDLLAKITYEALCLFLPVTPEVIHEFFESTFTISGSNGCVTHICVSDRFRKRVWYVNPKVLRAEIPVDQIKFHPHHRLDFRVTPNGLTYVRIEFFGAFAFLVAVGLTDIAKTPKNGVLSRALFFPCDRSSIEPEEYPSRYRTIVEADHARAWLSWGRFCSGD